jgi:pSer/pThr/pTyr-binding forkhead associated (FHA) protein
MGSARTVFVDASSMPEPSTPGMPAPGGPAAEPAAPSAETHRARLVLLRDDGSDGGMLALEAGPEKIGRNYGPPFDTDAYLDPEHVGLTVTAEGITIEDKNSVNGVYVKLDGRVELQNSDQFRVGQELLLYEDLPEPTPAKDGTERMGSPNPGYWGRVAVVVEPNRFCAAHPIKEDGILIGRESGDLSFPEDGYVSGSHCQISGDDSGVYIEDLGSSNGTYLRVRDGQVIPVGSLVLVGQQLFRLDPG